MEITHRNEADDGDLPVRMYGGTFADVQLSPGTYLTMRSPADCDRLIKAAAAAKSLLLGDIIPPLLAQDLGIAAASPANPYGSTKHGRFGGVSAAEVAQGTEPVEGHVMDDDELLERQIKTVLGMTDNPIPMAASPAVEPSPHLPQHKGGHPECTAPGCGEPGHHLHAIEIVNGTL